MPIKFFRTRNNDKIAFIPIEQIELDHVMINTLISYNFDNFDRFITRDRYEVVGNKLNRMKRTMKGMHERTIFPPVTLIIHQTTPKITYVAPNLRRKGVKPKKIPSIISYSIIDGRHRVVGSILNNYSHIPAIIKKNKPS